MHTMPTTFEEAFAAVKTLLANFRASGAEYRSPKYKEEDGSNEFINKFFSSLVFLLLASLAPARAQALDVDLKLQQPHPSAWLDDLSGGFSKDTGEVSLSLGAGFGVKAFGGTVKHDLALSQASAGWFITDTVAKDKWWRGNWELLGELFAGGQFQPRDRSFVGLTPMIRYNFVTGSHWVPFLDGGAGLTYTDIRHPDLSTLFEFNVQPGVGTHFLLNKDTALTLQYRWLHFSNDQIENPNHGVNTEMFLVGLTRLF